MFKSMNDAYTSPHIVFTGAQYGFMGAEDWFTGATPTYMGANLHFMSAASIYTGAGLPFTSTTPTYMGANDGFTSAGENFKIEEYSFAKNAFDKLILVLFKEVFYKH